MDKKNVLAAIVIAPHGVRGDVKLKCFFSNILDIKKYNLFDKNGFVYKGFFKISSQSKKCIASFSNINNYDMANKLRGLELFIKKNDLPQLAKNDFYYNDMIGLNLFLPNGNIFGNIVNIGNFGAGEVVEIACSGIADTVMMPVIDSVFLEINIQKGYAIVEPMEILS